MTTSAASPIVIAMPDLAYAELVGLRDFAAHQDFLFAVDCSRPSAAWLAVVPELAQPAAWLFHAGLPVAVDGVVRDLEGTSSEFVWRWRRGFGLDALRVPSANVVRRVVTSEFPVEVFLDVDPSEEVVVDPSPGGPRWLAGLVEAARGRRAAIEAAMEERK